MQLTDTEDTTPYIVVIDEEERYSIWAEYRDIPPGWTAAGKTGSKAECLEYIKSVWTDMRPLSLRRQMESEASKL
jgi:MbtH protein